MDYYRQRLQVAGAIVIAALCAQYTTVLTMALPSQSSNEISDTFPHGNDDSYTRTRSDTSFHLDALPLSPVSNSTPSTPSALSASSISVHNSVNPSPQKKTALTHSAGNVSSLTASSSNIPMEITPAVAIYGMQGTLNRLTDIIERNINIQSSTSPTVPSSLRTQAITLLQTRNDNLLISEKTKLVCAFTKDIELAEVYVVLEDDELRQAWLRNLLASDANVCLRSAGRHSRQNTAMSTIRKSAPVLLQRLQQGISVPPVELIYTPHPRWPLPHPQIIQQHPNRPLRMSILDSSFNPPTLAHLALVNSPRPSYRDDGEQNSEIQHSCGYDAKLLLLSVKNADKSLKVGDAMYQQRLEMMLLLSKDVRASTKTATSHSLPEHEAENVAIAIIDKPTFVGKSSALLDFLQRRLTTPLPLELTFLVGLDTLERLFSPRYYSSETDMMTSLRQFLSAAPQGDNSRIVCAKRVSSPAETTQLTESLDIFRSIALAKEFRESQRIVVIDIDNVVNSYSSSAIRSAIGRLGFGQSIDQDSGWKSMVTRDIADYIVEQQLYVD